VESPDPIRQFSGRRYINLESYDKNGEPKLTPVLSLEHEGMLYVRTGPTKWKVKRIRRNPRVRVVPCNQKGIPNGTWVDGEAGIVEGEELEQAITLFKKEYGTIGNLLRGVVYRLFRGERLTTIISIRLQPHIGPRGDIEPA
jgi:PPOX class probable F420-dependent enzyme